MQGAPQNWIESIGLHVGQLADYRRPLPCGREAHLQVFPGPRVRIHIDEHSLHTAPVRHALDAFPAAALGFLVGLCIAQPGQRLITSAIVGGTGLLIDWARHYRAAQAR